MARTLEEIEADLEATRERYDDLNRERAAVEKERDAGLAAAVKTALPSDWEATVANAVRTAMSDANFYTYGEADLELTPHVKVQITVDVQNPDDAEADDDDEEEAA